MSIDPHPLSALDTIRYHGWLHYVSDELREAVLARCRVHTAAAGDVVFRMEEPSDGVYGVVRGAFRYEVAPIERGPHLVHTFTAGTWVGRGRGFFVAEVESVHSSLCGSPSTCTCRSRRSTNSPNPVMRSGAGSAYLPVHMSNSLSLQLTI